MLQCDTHLMRDGCQMFLIKQACKRKCSKSLTDAYFGNPLQCHVTSHIGLNSLLQGSKSATNIQKSEPPTFGFIK